MCVIVNKRVRPVLGPWSSLLHVDGSDSAIAREDFFDLVMARKLGVDGEGNEESGAVEVSEIVVLEVTHDFRTLVEIGELDLELEAFDVQWVLRVLVIGAAGAADELEANERIRLLRRFLRLHNLNLFNLAVDEKVAVERLCSEATWEISDPQFPNS